MVELSAGELVADKYRIDHVIGAGGMGVVLAATHLDLGQPVAIKVLRDANEEAIARFQREARLIVRLKSVHVAKVFDVGSLDDDTPYYVMERLDGEDLSRILVKRKQLPTEQAVDYVLEASEAIAEAHTLGVVHRDLKPANLFVARGPGGKQSVKVLDFGISKTVTEGSQVGHLTNEGVAMGSPGYMAPEQIESSRDVDARADIYSLGAILYRLTSGASPYKGETIMSVLASMASTPLRPLASIADVPAAFAEVVERCLAHDREKRPATVAELAKLLAPFGSRRAQTSLEQILATMGVDQGPDETITLPTSQPDLALVTVTGHVVDDEPSTIKPMPDTLVLPATPRTPMSAVRFAPSSEPVPITRRPAASSVGLWPLVFAMGFFIVIVGFVAYRRHARPAPVQTETPELVETVPVIATTAAPPEPSFLPTTPTATATIETTPRVKPTARPHPRPAPAPVPAPKKPTDAPPSINDMPGGRH